MNRYKYLILTIVLFLTCITNTYATCTQEEINEFKKVEEEYKITYEFDKNTKTYTLTLYETDYKKYSYMLIDEIKTENIISATKTSTTYSKVKPGKYDINIIGRTETCKDILKTINLNLTYNKYFEHELCKGIEEFVLCQPTYNKELTEEEFKSRINTYKKNHVNEEKVEEPLKEKEENKILLYIKENLIEIIIITVFVILVFTTICVSIQSVRKSRRLE